MQCIEKGTDIRRLLHWSSSISALLELGDVSVAQCLVSGVWWRSVEVVGSNLARGKIFTASIGSVDSVSVILIYVNISFSQNID